ncbi:hypothetical protein RJT34_30941 [Clitoria ternatea]|uniref:Pectinesterase inhibitor domain-containing protein n=1 Tax=Clitoria ternatea TaxID=43366 RepID=A0AAN9EUC9_CLITE
MKFSIHLLVIFSIFLFQRTEGSNNLISESCREASKNDPNLSHDFCVASLEEASTKSKPPPSSLKDLVGMSIQLTKSNGTIIVSLISELLKNKSFDHYAKACLLDCSKLYSDSLSDLEDAVAAFESKDFDTANIKASAALDNSVTCEDQFKDKKGESSPLTKENHIFFQLNVMSLAFIQMFRQYR